MRSITFMYITVTRQDMKKAAFVSLKSTDSIYELKNIFEGMVWLQEVSLHRLTISSPRPFLILYKY